MSFTSRIAAAAARGYGMFRLAAGAAVDPFFNYVTALLHGDGTNGAQNNTFLDSSTNNFTITRNGNTTQGTFSPFSQTGWSNYFGSGNYFTVSPNAAFNVSTGAYTFEAWVYFATAPSTTILFGLNGTGITGYINLLYSGGTLYWQERGTSTNQTSYVWTPSVGQWYHIAIGWNGSNSLAIWINGTRVATNTVSPSAAGQNGLNIGAASDGYAVVGYLSNFRLVKGTDVYGVGNASITVPTSPLTAISGTSLLTCQANRFLDASSNAFAITVTGSPSVQAFGPFNPTSAWSASSNGGSGYFDGSGDYLSIADNAALEGFDDFTIEFWVYLNSTSDQTILTKGWDASTAFSPYNINITSGNLVFTASYNGSSWAVLNQVIQSSIGTGRWYHIAVSRSGSTYRLFSNGSLTTTVTSSGTLWSNTAAVTIGVTSAATQPLNGYLCDLRIVKGTAVYTAAFTPPTAPLTAITNTSLLLNYTNAGIYDNAAVGNYETVGNAQVSTAVKKYGTGSMAFDGTGDYLTTPYSQSINFGTGDFTIEGWFYLNSFANQYYVLGGTWTTGTSDEWLIQIENNGSLRFLTTANTSFFATGLIKTGTWYHFAASRSAGVIKAYINGSVFATITNANSIGSVSKTLNIGQQPGGVWPWNGYLDDWRVSKGIGRYPYNFTPPTAAFPNIGGTVTPTSDQYFNYTTLLLPGNGTNGAQNNTFLDSSSNAFTITRNGNTTQGTFTPFSQTGWGNYLNGSSYLTIADNTALDMGSSDFTIEGWYFPTGNATSAAGIFSKRATNATVGGVLLYYGATGLTPSLLVDIGGSFAINTASSVSFVANQWNHFAVVRNGSAFNLYINGLSGVSATNAGAIPDNAAAFAIGAGAANGNNPISECYVSNFRVVKGTAVYTSNFTPSATPLTAITNTSLLTCQSNRFLDASSNAFAITVNGSPSVQAFSPFAPTAAYSASTVGGSGYFDGSGDYLTVPDSTAFTMGTGDFSVECWYYPTSAARQSVVAQTNAAGNTLAFWVEKNASNQLRLVANVGGTDYVATATATMPLNAWSFLQMVRSGTTIYGYQNGTQVCSVAVGSGSLLDSADVVSIGGGTVSLPVTGYIADVRILKGTASSATTPTAPLTAIANTQLLLSYTNGGITDATAKNNLETVGNAQISTTQSKFGGSSMYFDGTGDWLSSPDGQNYNLGSGDFTIECWVYVNNLTNPYGVISKRTDTGTQYRWIVATINSSTGTINCQLTTTGSSWAINANTTSAITATTWNHIAFVRYGSDFSVYVNGIKNTLSSALSGSVYNGTEALIVGAGGTTGAYVYSMNGYIDDLRITKGIARYTSNFTPPTTAFLTL